MPHASDQVRVNANTYSEAEVEYRDSLQEIISALSGVEKALCYRAEAENDDMLAMLADVVYSQVERLRQAIKD